jgi:hypothetical protein
MSKHHVSFIPRQLLLRGALVAGLGSALALGALPVGTAGAATTPVTTPCGAPTLTQPFTPWSDSGYYWLLPGGNFEGSLSGWTLSGGAGTVAGSEPYAVTGSLGARSMALPAGSSVQTPFNCVDGADTYFRFFALNRTAAAAINVSVVYAIAGVQTAFAVGTVSGDATWAPSIPLHTGGKIASKLSANGTAEMAIRFTASGGTSQIDDVFVDPRLKH